MVHIEAPVTHIDDHDVLAHMIETNHPAVESIIAAAAVHDTRELPAYETLDNVPEAESQE